MRNRIWLAAGGSVLAASISLLGTATAASASAAGTSTVVGYTYLDGNTAGANTIDGFARHADGSVTPLPGSPFAAGGAGLGTGLASQGAIQATPGGRYLLAADAGSNQISVLRITSGGVPVPVGRPVSSGGIKPVSVAVSPAGLVYVANSGAGGSGYSGFRLHADGSLTPIPGSTVTVPDSSGLGDVFFNAFGNHLIGTRTGTSQIDSFVVLPGGHLLAAKGSPFTGQGLGQLGAEFSPARPGELFVSNAHNGTGLGTVSAYRDSLLGQLTPIGASPYADGQTAPCWVEISHDGKYLFVTNTASGNISGYAINPEGSLTLIGTTAIKGGGADIDERLSPDGRYLLVDGSGNHILSVFAVSGGNLTEVASSPTPLPAGGSPAGIVNI
jgi:DNA-binding beta-propeller fold protein YncE